MTETHFWKYIGILQGTQTRADDLKDGLLSDFLRRVELILKPHLFTDICIRNIAVNGNKSEKRAVADMNYYVEIPNELCKFCRGADGLAPWLRSQGCGLRSNSISSSGRLVTRLFLQRESRSLVCGSCSLVLFAKTEGFMVVIQDDVGPFLVAMWWPGCNTQIEIMLYAQWSIKSK